MRNVNLQIYSQLYTAVKTGNTGILKEIIDSGADINANDGRALRLACEHNQTMAAILILENGGRTNAGAVTSIHSSLSWAVRHGNLELVTMLLKHGAIVSCSIQIKYSDDFKIAYPVDLDYFVDHISKGKNGVVDTNILNMALGRADEIEKIINNYRQIQQN